MTIVPGRDLPSVPAARRWLGAVGGLLAFFLIFNSDWRKDLALWWEGSPAKIGAVVHGACWWGSLLALGLIVSLFLTSGWWAKAWPAAATNPDPERERENGRAGRWFPMAVLAAMVLGAGLRAPRLGLSLYNDECHVFRVQISGSVPLKYLGDADRFRPVSWISTLWENRAGNNAMPFSILARTSYDTWRKITGTPDGVVNETALRIPVLICGVLAIGAMGLLGRRLGGPAMGAAAAVLTALHPWHMRYSVEARPYGLLLLMIPLLFLALHRAWRTGRWRDWMLFGLAEYFTVACFMASAHFLIALNVILGMMTLIPAIRGPGGNRLSRVSWNILFPVLVAGTSAAALYLTLNFPHFVQLSKALADPAFFHSRHPFNAAWFQDVSVFLSFGMPALDLNSQYSAQPSLAGLYKSSGIAALVITAVTAAAVLLAAGFRNLFRRDAVCRVCALTIPIGAAITLAYCQWKGIVFLKWYTLFLLPGVILLLAAGVAALSGSAARRRPWGVIMVIPLVICWLPPLQFNLTHSRENLRALVETARGAEYPASLKNPAHTLFAVTWSESPVYDPSAASLRMDGDLEVLIVQARNEHRELFVEHGFRDQARQSSPKVLARLENQDEFELAGVFPGMDEVSTTHWLYRLKDQPSQ